MPISTTTKALGEISAMKSLFPVPDQYKINTNCDLQKYQEMYKDSIENNDGFWNNQGKRLDWIKDYTQVKDVSFAKDDLHIKWYCDGILNVSYNCIDRHLKDKAEQTAIIWEGDNPDESEYISYRKLYQEVCKLSNSLKKLGIKKGDCVTLYMPMIPEAAYAMLACTRIGAIHSIVFGGFSPDALANRIINCESKLVITADRGLRGGKTIPLKKNVDKAIELEGVKDYLQSVLVFKTSDSNITLSSHDYWYHELSKDVELECPPEPMNAEDPLFILYTSGSTGQPKGVLHTTGGYLVYVSLGFEYIFDYNPGDVFWCTADVGWITGHSYVVYGPLANGATTLMFEGVPNYPDYSRFWQIIDKHQVNTCYTAPTAIRSIMREGDDYVACTSRKSLKLLGSVGEPINVEAWNWFYEMVGDKRCPIVDTWWQTETGGIMIAPLPGAIDLKPGMACVPFFGVEPLLLDNDGNILTGATSGNLVLAGSWPSQMRTIWGDHNRFYNAYFDEFPGYYMTGDGAERDADGYIKITGRLDDVLNISGHRMGTAEVENALDEHKSVAEAAVVGYPHDIKGQGIYAYVSLYNGIEPSEELRAELVKWVRKEIGPVATPDKIQWAPQLPKTRSGKIMRRILRKIAANNHQELGDVSTLADPEVVTNLIENRMNK